MPLREHLADERVGVARAAADVPVDPLAGGPVLLPGNTTESPFLDQEPQHAKLQLELLGGTGTDSPSPAIRASPHRAAQRRQVVERGLGIDGREWCRVVRDPTDHRGRRRAGGVG